MLAWLAGSLGSIFLLIIKTSDLKTATHSHTKTSRAASPVVGISNIFDVFHFQGNAHCCKLISKPFILESLLGTNERLWNESRDGGSRHRINFTLFLPFFNQNLDIKLQISVRGSQLKKDSRSSSLKVPKSCRFEEEEEIKT